MCLNLNSCAGVRAARDTDREGCLQAIAGVQDGTPFQSEPEIHASRQSLLAASYRFPAQQRILPLAAKIDTAASEVFVKKTITRMLLPTSAPRNQEACTTSGCLPQKSLPCPEKTEEPGCELGR